MELIANLGIGPTHSLAPTSQFPSVTALFLVRICSGAFADCLEGDIVSDRINLSLERSLGGGLIIICKIFNLLDRKSVV